MYLPPPLTNHAKMLFTETAACTQSFWILKLEASFRNKGEASVVNSTVSLFLFP